MLEQIERDVMRTHPDMHFFSGDDPIAVRHRKARTAVTQAAGIRLTHAALCLQHARQFAVLLCKCHDISETRHPCVSLPQPW